MSEGSARTNPDPLWDPRFRTVGNRGEYNGGMTEIVVKRVFDVVGRDDGWRVLVDRLWPRGISKERLELDFWAKDVAPSIELRQWFGHDPQKMTEFRQRYRQELAGNPAVDRMMSELADKSKVTLLYAVKDEQHNHAVVLAEYMLQRLKDD